MKKICKLRNKEMDERVRRFEQKANSYCNGCRHWKSLAGVGTPKFCDYLCDVGMPRDCEPLGCKHHTKLKRAYL